MSGPESGTPAARGAHRRPPAAARPAPADRPGRRRLPGSTKDAGPAPGVAYADLGIRIVAYIVDVIIVGILFFVVGAIILGVLAGIGGFGGFLLGFVFLVAFNAAFSRDLLHLRLDEAAGVAGPEDARPRDGERGRRGDADPAAGDPPLARPVRSVRGSCRPSSSSSAPRLGSLFGLISLGYLIYLLYTTNRTPSARASTTTTRTRSSSSAPDRRSCESSDDPGPAPGSFAVRPAARSPQPIAWWVRQRAS